MLRSRTPSSSTTVAACSRRRIRRRRPGSSRPRREVFRGCGKRPRSRCPRCSRFRTSRRITSCSSGSTKAAPDRHRSGSRCRRSHACIEPARRRSGARTGAPRGAAGCRTSRARPGPSSMQRTASCRWPGWRATADALPPSAIAALETSRGAARVVRQRGEPPARLHGDLWAGNRLVDVDGRSWLIDPAAHGGHREFDLAMMRLFGGFGAACFAAYDEAYPLERRLGGSGRRSTRSRRSSCTRSSSAAVTSDLRPPAIAAYA